MEDSFIDLDRSFNLIPTCENDDRDLSSFYSTGATKGVRWEHLLKLSRVIILAEAGAGKTAEIKNKSQQLKQDGQCSFFLRLEDLKDNFENAFLVGDIVTFEEWAKSQEQAYFFLDSVDESKISNERDFQKALRCFEKKIRAIKNRTNIYMTSRGSAWRPATDLKLVNDLFHTNSQKQPHNTFEVYSFTELSHTQITTFAETKGVCDIENFVNQLKTSEAEVFAKRPLDLIDLIIYWQKNCKIGSRLELIQTSIDGKLEKVELGRDPSTLSFLSLKQGAIELAAALTFCKSSHIAIPDNTIEIDALSAKRILDTWTVDEVSTLLCRPIFESSLYGAVRFTHRLIREYLTSLWVYERVTTNALSQTDLRTLFYNHIYDVEVPVLTLKPVLAWYVLLDQCFAKTAMDISPEIFIEGGDAAKITIEQRENLLTKFCKMYGEKDQCYISFDANAIKRFSNSSLGPRITELLDKYYSYKELRQILLQMALSEKMHECLAIAIRISKDNEMDPLSKTLSIRLIDEVTDFEFKVAHAKELLNEAPIGNIKIAAVIIAEVGNLVPFPLLMKSIAKLDVQAGDYHTNIQYSIEKFVDNLSYETAIEAVDYFYELIDSKPYSKDRESLVSEKYEWLFDCMQLLLQKVLLRKDTRDLNYKVLELISRAEIHHTHNYDSKHHIELAAITPKWQALNSRLFWHDVNIERAKLLERDQQLNRWYQARRYQNFWYFNTDYLDTAIEWINTKNLTDDRFVALTLAWDLVKKNGNTTEDNANLDMAARTLEGANELLHHFRNPEKSDWEIENEQRQQKSKEQLKKDEIHQKENFASSLTYIKENQECIEELKYASSGQINSAQLYLFRYINKKSDEKTSYSWLNCNLLIPDFGEEVAIKYRNFAIEYWKEYQDNILLSEGSERNSTTYAGILALSGIGIEENINPNWVDTINSKLAIKAAKLAMCNLNEFPQWFHKVFSRFPNEITSLLVHEIEWCINDESEEDSSHYVLGKIFPNSDYLFDRLGKPIFDLLKKYEVISEQILINCLNTLILSKSVTDSQLANLAQERITSELNSNLFHIWWTIYISTNSIFAIRCFDDKLSKLSKQNATNLAIQVITTLDNRHGYVSFINRDMVQTVDSLVALYNLMHKYIRTGDDIHRNDGGCYSSTLRDDAQSARNGLLTALKQIPGEKTYNALREIAKVWQAVPWQKSWIEHLALERATADGGLTNMSENEFRDYSKELSKTDNSKVEININAPVTDSVIGQNVKDVSIEKNNNNSHEIGAPSQQKPPEYRVWYDRFGGKIMVNTIAGTIVGVITIALTVWLIPILKSL